MERQKIIDVQNAQTMKKFSDKYGVKVNNLYLYENYYLPGFNQGLRGQELQAYVDKEISDYNRRNYDPKC